MAHIRKTGKQFIDLTISSVAGGAILTISLLSANSAEAATITANPANVAISPGGSTGTTILTWNAPEAPGSIVFGISTNGSPEVFSSIYSRSGSTNVPYIALGNTYRFNLYALPHTSSSPVLASIAVSGFAQPSAAPACNFTYSPASPPPSQISSLGTYKTICLQPGIYFFSSPLQLGTGQTLRSSTGNRNDVTLKSTANRIILLSSSARIRDLTIIGTGASTEYGILAYYKSDLVVSNVSISKTLIGIGSVGSSNLAISDCAIFQTGDQPPIGNARPSIWVASSYMVSVRRCRIQGEMDPARIQDNDGGSAFYDSSNITFANNFIERTGIVYFVNVDGGLVSGNDAIVGTEWGLDIVGGTRNVEFRDNYIQGMGWGGGILWQTSNLTFNRNIYVNNNRFGVAYCSGINTQYAQCSNTNTGIFFSNERSFLNGISESSAQCRADGWPSSCP